LIDGKMHDVMYGLWTATVFEWMSSQASQKVMHED
jgi:hypothetical protein